MKEVCMNCTSYSVMLSCACLVRMCREKDGGCFFLLALCRHTVFACLLALSHSLHDWTSCLSFLPPTRPQLELGENFWTCSEMESWTPCPSGALSHSLSWSPVSLQWCWGTPGSHQRVHSAWHSEQGWLARESRSSINLMTSKNLPPSKDIPDKIVWLPQLHPEWFFWDDDLRIWRIKMPSDIL